MLIKLFPLFAILLSTVAYFFPDLFINFKSTIVPLLGLVMFGMGMRLSPNDFSSILSRPWPILIGLCLQFGIMPFAAWLIGTVLQLSTEYFIGMILLGVCSGGTASNVICYLAKGDVALSITITAFSTLLAIIAIPLLTLLYAGQTIDVPAQKMLVTILKVILLPVISGMAINYFIGARIKPLQQIFPIISVIAIIFVIAIIVALNHLNIAQTSFILLIAIVLHNSVGLAAGYYLARAIGYSHVIAKTLAIEVGMQNSGLAVVLASKYFSAAAALPGALFSIWHNISGSALAAIWNKKQPIKSSHQV